MKNEFHSVLFFFPLKVAFNLTHRQDTHCTLNFIYFRMNLLAEQIQINSVVVICLRVDYCINVNV